MCDAKCLAVQTLEEVTGYCFARGKRDRVHEAVELIPVLTKVGKQLFDLRVVRHVAFEHEARAKLGGEFLDTFLEALPDVAERKLGTLAVAGAGDAVGN